jgi:thiol-disulfide isomerase/thioredoxin
MDVWSRLQDCNQHQMKPVQRPSAAALILIAVGALGHPIAAEQFRGVLHPGLLPDAGFLVVLTRVAQPPDGVSIPASASIFGGSLLPMDEWQFRVLLVEPRPGSPFIFIDTNRNNVLGPAERFSFKTTRNQFGRRHVRVALPPPKGSAFGHIPLELLLADDRLPLTQRSSDQRYLLHSAFLYATAKVRIDGRSYFFRYSVEPDAGTIDLRDGLHLLDKGRLVNDYLSPWRAWARQEPPVFRIGDRYVSTTSIDYLTRTVVVETRAPDDYERLELYPGLMIPDFKFEDIDGSARRLAEFRGRYVLLNFWDSGCSPCTEEIPYLRAALERFGISDLVVIGLSQGGTPASMPAASLPPQGWVQATPHSVQRIILEWFQISSSPTTILLDREGRVLSLGKPVDGKRPLRGTELLNTLAKVISERR